MMRDRRYIPLSRGWISEASSGQESLDLPLLASAEGFASFIEIVQWLANEAESAGVS